jgi:hypothetical protein
MQAMASGLCSYLSLVYKTQAPSLLLPIIMRPFVVFQNNKLSAICLCPRFFPDGRVDSPMSPLSLGVRGSAKHCNV